MSKKASIKSYLIKLNRSVYSNNNDFVIVSNNCWGAEIYKNLGLQYNTPFVGLFLYGPDYLRLLEKLDYHLKLKLEFKKESKWTNNPINYPLGVLDEVEIHFLHYKNNEEAKLKWERRLERMNKITDKDNWFFKICDRDKVSIDELIRFHNLPYKNKISFGITPIDKNINHITITENDNNKSVPDGVTLYKISHKYFDPLEWVNSGKVKQTRYNKIKNALIRNS